MARMRSKPTTRDWLERVFVMAILFALIWFLMALGNQWYKARAISQVHRTQYIAAKPIGVMRWEGEPFVMNDLPPWETWSVHGVPIRGSFAPKSHQGL